MAASVEGVGPLPGTDEVRYTRTLTAAECRLPRSWDRFPRRAIADMNYARTVDGLHPIHSADTLTCRRTQRLTPTLH